MSGVMRIEIDAAEMQELADEKRATENDLAVALAEVRRLRAGIEHLMTFIGHPDEYRYCAGLLAPVDLT